MDFYVSPAGNDAWSGQLPAPNHTQTDGPLATIAGARNRLRTLTAPPLEYDKAWTPRGMPGPLTVHIRAGCYFLPEPLFFGPEDSFPVTYAAYPGETPILDGGQRITNWRVEQVNGVTGWVADLPEVAADQWHFRSLFVNGQRRPRPRLPKEGFYHIAETPRLQPPKNYRDGNDVFVCQAGDIKAWRHIGDVELLVLHRWIAEHLSITDFNETTRLVTLARRSLFALEKDKYYVENVFEALTQPGEWYLDRRAGRLYYIPMAGEDPHTTEVMAPRLTQLMRLVGQPGAGRYVQFLRFRGLTFQHTDAAQPDGDILIPQAASYLPGVIYMEAARGCAIEDCTIRRIGWYAVELADGCTANRIVGNALTDLGGGGVKLNGSDAGGPLALRTGYNVVTDNHIHHGGRVFHEGVGILSRHSFGNVIAHNHIHDLYYSGISVGWVWGFGDNVSRNNMVEKNHIHHLGFGWLSDMGGIYTLGVQPGTILRGNVIHDIVSAEYGGWAIYPDEGSSHLVIENNLCYNTNSHVFHQHFGHENMVRNNIFACGGEGAVALSRTDGTVAFTLMRNILVTDGQPLYAGGYGHQFETDFNPVMDLNLLWDSSGSPRIKGGGSTNLDMTQWLKLGNDHHSLVADPLFQDLKNGDFTLQPESPALSLGFQPLDISDVGPRPSGHYYNGGT